MSIDVHGEPASSPAGSAPLRRLPRGEGPYPGLLTGDPTSLVWVDDGELAGNAVWRAGGDGHVLAPRDVGQGPSGAVIAFDHCTRRLSDFIDETNPLSAGEAVTVAVSIVRAATEAHRLGERAGQWWVTESGKPVVALTGDASWADSARDLLEDIARTHHGPLGALITEAAELIASPRRLDRDGAAWEDAVLAQAPPASLRTPRDPTPATRPRRPSAAIARPEARERFGTLRDWASRFTSPGWADRLAAALPRRRRTPTLTLGQSAEKALSPDSLASEPTSAVPERVRHRRFPLLVAAAAATVVLAAGLWWPTESDATSAPEPTTSGTPSTSAAPASPSVLPGAPAASEEPADAARQLAEADLTCADDSDCARSLREEVASQALTRMRPPAELVTLIEDFGDIVVFRVDANDEAAAQILVIVRDGRQWLIRDVYDVAAAD